MNRMIKFRGKRIDAGEWCFGNLFIWRKYNSLKTMIGEGVQNGSVMGYEVDPATVGQFTWLYDRDGKEIYDGDMVEPDPVGSKWAGSVLVVVFRYGTFGVHHVTANMFCSFITHLDNGFAKGYCEIDNEYSRTDMPFVRVIGNIHDNSTIIESK